MKFVPHIRALGAYESGDALSAKMQSPCPEITLHHRDIVTPTALCLVVEIHTAMNNCQPRSQMMGEPWIHGKKGVSLCSASAERSTVYK